MRNLLQGAARALSLALEGMASSAAILLALSRAVAAAGDPAPFLPDPEYAKAPVHVLTALSQGEPQDVIVLIDDRQVQQQSGRTVRQRGLRHEDAAILAQKATLYLGIKRRLLASVSGADLELKVDYSHLPMALVRAHSLPALRRLLLRSEVVQVFADRVKYKVLDAQSQNLIGQPVAAALGFRGAGAAVLVIDDGADYAQPDLGSCTGLGAPSSCKVVAYLCPSGVTCNVGTGSTSGHGTNVASVVAGSAPDARLAVWNVFGSNDITFDSYILQAINWGIANQGAYSIRAINMSLGDNSDNASPCQSGNPYYSAIQNARSAGILTVAAAGNNGYTDGIGNPACTPGAVSVGAVYSGDWGGVGWLLPQGGQCSDATSAADKVICFSNAAPYLTVLSPGSFVTAGGTTLSGTSQAAPFLSGAIAVLRAGFPADSLDQTVARLTSTGVGVTDPRSGALPVFPRLNLGQAVRPINDLFGNAIMLTGSAGAATGTNVNAAKETGEPDHASNAGGKSVWWRWTAPANGQVNLNTHGSGFDTLLAVYTGALVAALTSVAANDDDSGGGVSGLLFQAQQGTTYRIAVDGLNGASGAVALNWSLNTTAAADIVVQLVASPGSPAVGDQVTYTATVRNGGPQTATNIRLIDALPPALSFVSASPGCVAVAGTVTCAIGDLANGASVTIQIVVTVSSSGQVSDQVSATSDVPDATSTNNSASITVTVSPRRASVPALPDWGCLVLGVLLLGAAVQAGRRPARKMG